MNQPLATKKRCKNSTKIVYGCWSTICVPMDRCASTRFFKKLFDQNKSSRHCAAEPNHNATMSRQFLRSHGSRTLIQRVGWFPLHVGFFPFLSWNFGIMCSTHKVYLLIAQNAIWYFLWYFRKLLHANMK